MAKEDIVTKLVGELDTQTEPYAAWNAAKEAIQKGTGSTRAQKKYLTAAFGPELTDRIEDYAVDFYGGRKVDAKHLAHDLRTDLKEKYWEFRAALRQGDIDTANKLIRDATENRYNAAGLEAIMERIKSLKPDERIAAGKKLARTIGADDYVTAATDPEQLADTLRRQKGLAEAYKVPGGAGAGGGGGHH